MERSRFIPLGDVVFVEKTSHGILLGVGEEKFRADVIRPDLLRLKISQSGQFDESPTFAASFRMPDPTPFRLTEDDSTIALDTGLVRLVVSRRPFALAAYRSDGTVIFEDHQDEAGSRGYRHLNDSFIVTRRIAPHDSIYGLGQKTGRFDRRGRKWILWNTDVLSPDAIRGQRLHEADSTLNGQSTSFDPYYTSIPFFYHCRANVDRRQDGGLLHRQCLQGEHRFHSGKAVQLSVLRWSIYRVRFRRPGYARDPGGLHLRHWLHGRAADLGARPSSVPISRLHGGANSRYRPRHIEIAKSRATSCGSTSTT